MKQTRTKQKKLRSYFHIRSFKQQLRQKETNLLWTETVRLHEAHMELISLLIYHIVTIRISVWINRL